MRRLSALAALLSPLANAATPDEWRSRSIYQLLTDRFASPTSAPCTDLHSYCGGTWGATSAQLDYIQALGFDSIWISPVVDQAPLGFHGYWQRRMHEPNANFGAWADVRNLADALHARGMYLMVDVVANHASADGDVSSNEPFNSTGSYHDCANCPSGCDVDDYTDHAQMEHCRLAGLMDFDNTDVTGPVATALYQWISFLVNATGADGLRVDTVPYVWPAFWQRFESAAGVYAVGEVDSGDVAFAAPYQSAALSGVLSYPLFFELRNVFASQQSMRALGDAWRAGLAAWHDVGLLGVFVDHHDTARFLSAQSDRALYAAALSYAILSDGIPIVYYGTEWLFAGGNDPDNREPFWASGGSYDAARAPFGPMLASLLTYRRSRALWASSAAQLERWQDDSFYAFTKGDGTLAAFSNVGSHGADQTRTVTFLPAAWSVGTEVCDPLDCTVCATVAGGPSLDVTVVGWRGFVVLDPAVARC
jgi:alpha-amylase